MKEIWSRLFRVARASIPSSEKWPWAGFAHRKQEEAGEHAFHRSRGEYATRDEETRREGHRSAGGEPYPGFPSQIVEDLAVFNLVPPASMEAVKRARNQEIKKYHPDRFGGDPEKQVTAKEILQIYNAAYDRLKVFYGNR